MGLRSSAGEIFELFFRSQTYQVRYGLTMKIMDFERTPHIFKLGSLQILFPYFVISPFQVFILSLLFHKSLK